MKLRDALGDSADKPLYIETIPKRGYRFVAPASAGLTAPIATPVVMLKQDARAGTSNLSSSRDGRTLLYAQSECKGSILMAEEASVALP
jgi:DNA-binding winged helix-turn-helix (wHTH) protein